MNELVYKLLKVFLILLVTNFMYFSIKMMLASGEAERARAKKRFFEGLSGESLRETWDRIFKSKRGEGYIDTAVIVITAVMVIALAVKVLPVFINKSRLDTFATEICREAETAGRIGSETTLRIQELKEQTGINPQITWTPSYGTQVQLNGKIVVTLTVTYDLGFGDFGSFPVTLRSEAVGRSEIYWK